MTVPHEHVQSASSVPGAPGEPEVPKSAGHSCLPHVSPCLSQERATWVKCPGQGLVEASCSIHESLSPPFSGAAVAR